MRLILAIALVTTAAAPAFAQAKPAALDDDKLVCKRQVETGSLVRAKRTCMTRKDWRDQMLRTQEDARQATLPINSQAPQ